MCAVVKVLHRRADLLRKCFLNPFPLHSAGQAEQRRVLDYTLTHQGALPSFRQIAIEGPPVAPEAQLIDESRHYAAEQRVTSGGWWKEDGGWSWAALRVCLNNR